MQAFELPGDIDEVHEPNIILLDKSTFVPWDKADQAEEEANYLYQQLGRWLSTPTELSPDEYSNFIVTIIERLESLGVKRADIEKLLGNNFFYPWKDLSGTIVDIEEVLD